MFADEKTVVFTFSQIQATTATVNVSGNGADGITATVGRATQTSNNTPTNYFTSGEGYNENVLGVNYTNSKDNYWEIPFTINGLKAGKEYTITTQIMLLNNAGNKQNSNTTRTWTQTIYVNSSQHDTTGEMAFNNYNSSLTNTFLPFTATSPLNLTVRMLRNDNNGCFAGIKSITLSYCEDEEVYDEYRVNIKGEDVSGLQVMMTGERSAKCTNIASDGESIGVMTNQTPKAVDFKLIGSGSDLDNKFVWGPVIDKRMKTITFGISNKATDLQTGFYQLMLKDNAEITKANNLISKFADNENTASNYLYLAPSVYHLDDAKFKFTGTPTYGNETATYVYIKKNDNNTVDITGVGGAEFKGLAYSFSNSNGEITFTGYGIKNYTQTDNQGTIKYEPKEMPSLVSGAGTTTYTLNAVSLTNCDAYYIEYAGKYNAQTRFTYKKATPTGISNYGNNELFIVNKAMSRAVEGLDEADFVSDDAVCTNIVVVETPTDAKPGKIRLTLETATVKYKVVIAGDARQESDRVVYNNHDYANEQTVNVPVTTVPSALDFKTNVTDRFVWGPIIDHEAKTVTFDIRPLATEIEGGWYQMQLIEGSGTGVTAANVNQRIASVSGNINTQSNYIYITPLYNPATNWLGKMTGIPSYGEEPVTYFYIEKSGSNLSIQSPNGLYANGHRLDGRSVSKQTFTNYDFNNGILKVKGWTAPGYWNSTSCSGEEGPNVATGDNNVIYQSQYLTKIDIAAKYDVYQIDLQGTNQNTVKFVGDGNCGIGEVFNNGYFFLDKDSPEPTKEMFKFDGITTITDIQISGEKVITFTVTSPATTLNNTIIHRQHDVYDRLEMVSADKKPGNNYIKKGEGLMPHPYADNFTDAGYTDNDRHLQNTSVFNITQYVKSGERTECVLPYTKNKGVENHVAEYQRWYDYTTERCLADEIITLDNSSSTLGSFHAFTNGHSNYGPNAGGTIVRLTDHRAKADIKLPTGKTEIYVGVDASEFQDAKSLTNGNLMEPSLNMRVIYHIVSAHEMAKKLTTDGDTWWEEKSYYVPNVKRGSDTYRNNADLLPLDMPFSNYWIYKTKGEVDVEQDASQLMPIVAENGSYETLGRNLKIVVEGLENLDGSAEDYLEVGIFNGNPGGIGSAAYINSNHFIYYKLKGSDVTRRLPEGSQAVIKVYAKDGDNNSSPEYQLAKFTLNFQGDCEPLPITSVIGNEASTRSVDYFQSKKLKQVASMTFQEKENAFTKIISRRTSDNNEPYTYAFPIDFDRTSYGYSPNYTYGNYSVTRQGWGIKYQPVALYERNIKDPSNSSMSITDDYFFYIDAAEAPGQVASVPLEGTLCAGTRLYCYGWLGSGNAYNGGGNPAGASVILELVGRDNDGKDHVLASYMPGTLTDITYDLDGNEMRSLSYGRTPSMEKAHYMDPAATQVGVWNSIGFSFLVKKDMAYASYEMRIINNCFSTAGGDYSLDDFRIFANPPKGEVDFTTPLCSDKVRHAKVHADYDMLRDLSGVNDKQLDAKINATYCFVDAEIFDNYKEGDYVIKDMFDIDETGNHTLKPEYDATTDAVKNIINHAFRDALVGSRYTKGSGHEDYGYHSYEISQNYESIEPYAYNDSKNETVYREQRGDGVRRVVFKEDVIRGEMQMVKKEDEHHPAYWPHLRPSRTYYLMFSPMGVTQALIDEEHTATQVFEIHSSCSFFGKFTTKDPLHVILDNADIESDLPVKAVCHGETVDFSFNMPAMKLEKNYPIIDEEYCTSDKSLDGQIVPSTNGAKHYRYESVFTTSAVYDVIKDMPYDWWLGGELGGKEFGGKIEDYLSATHPTIKYDKPKDKTNKKDGDPVSIAQAMTDFRFFYPDVDESTLSTVTKKEYNSDTGYGLLDSEINTIKSFVEAGIIVLKKTNYSMSLTAGKSKELTDDELSKMTSNELNSQILNLAITLDDDPAIAALKPLKDLEAAALKEISNDGRKELTFQEFAYEPYDQVKVMAGKLVDSGDLTGITAGQINTMPESQLRKAVENALRAMTPAKLEEFAINNFTDIGPERRAHLVIRALNIMAEEAAKDPSVTDIREHLRNKMITIFSAQKVDVLRKMWKDASAKLTDKERAELLGDKNPETMTDQTELGTLIEKALAVITNGIIADLNSDKYIHFTLVPIMPSQENFVDEPYIFCPEPRGVKIRITSHEPHMIDGFADMPYPEDMDNVPVRLGLPQIKETMESTGKNLRIPVRGLKKAAKDGEKAIKLSERTGYYTDIFLTKTDDPLYQQTPNAGVLSDAKNDEGIYTRMVGKVKTMVAVYPTAGNLNPDNYLEVSFDNGMKFREGYTYRVGINFMEVKEVDVEGVKVTKPTISCPGEMLLDLKIVPEYQKWTASVNNDWTNDKNWARASRAELNAGNAAAGNKIDDTATALDDASSYIDNDGDGGNGTVNSFVPMYFTNVLFGKDAAPALYTEKETDESEAYTPASRSGKTFLKGMHSTATDRIVYDMEVVPADGKGTWPVSEGDYECGLFGTYIANGITFLPGSQLVNAHFLDYKKAWVEYELTPERWYTLSSPLQNTFAGEWYSPTDGGRQVTPHFYGIEYDHERNHRFQPAYYQRSWDNEGNNLVYLKQGGEFDAYVRADWSFVYNDVTKEYSEGGFSVKASDGFMEHKPSNGKVLVRMPKADAKYTYYDKDNQTGAKPDDVLKITEGRYRLWSDKVKDGETFTQTIKNKTEDNNFFLVGNPFMANMDMDAFFDENPGLEKKFWIMTEEGQKVSVKVDGDLWIGTDGTVGKVAPLQGFFVKGTGNTVSVTFSADMQKASDNAANTPVYGTRAASVARGITSNMVRLSAERNGAKSAAVIMLSDNAKEEYVAGEDCEVFIDENLYDRPTVYTSADAMAQTINVRKSLNMVPVGMISSDDSEAVLTFDLGSYTSDALYLYDSTTDSYIEIEDGTSVTMSGNNAGRYYLTTIATNLDELTAQEEAQRKGVWTVSGIYRGESIKGLPSGVYIVDGVKMLIK